MASITVLMPVYNAEAFLREAIQSILDQSFKDFELMLIDDGSTDSSASIIASFNDTRIRHVAFEKNRGLIAVLNHGLQLIGTTYIARMDADDIALRERLQTQFNWMEAHPEVTVSGSAVEYFGAKQGVMRAPKDQPEILWTLTMGSPFFHPTVIMRANDLRAHAQGYPAFPHAEDYALWCQLAPHCKFGNIDEVLLRYRVSDASVSSKFSDVQQANGNLIRRNYFEQLLQRKLQDQEWESINPFATTPVALPIAAAVLIELNNRQHLFSVKEFRPRMLKRIKQLILRRGFGPGGRGWLMNHISEDLSLLKYLLKS